jgi:hypothetical protein
MLKDTIGKVHKAVTAALAKLDDQNVVNQMIQQLSEKVSGLAAAVQSGRSLSDLAGDLTATDALMDELLDHAGVADVDAGYGMPDPTAGMGDGGMKAAPPAAVPPAAAPPPPAAPPIPKQAGAFPGAAPQFKAMGEAEVVEHACKEIAKASAEGARKGFMRLKFLQKALAKIAKDFVSMRPDAATAAGDGFVAGGSIADKDKVDVPEYTDPSIMLPEGKPPIDPVTAGQKPGSVSQNNDVVEQSKADLAKLDGAVAALAKGADKPTFAGWPMDFGSRDKRERAAKAAKGDANARR